MNVAHRSYVYLLSGFASIMKTKSLGLRWLFVSVCLVGSHCFAAAAPVQGWLAWRGPNQTGHSLEKGLPDKINGAQPLWTADYPGQSTPVIANGKVYIMGYYGDGPDLQE